MTERNALYTICFALVLIAVSMAFAASGDLPKIQQAIRDQGAKWQAAETPYSHLTQEEIRGMLGLLPGYYDEESFNRLPHFKGVSDDFDTEVDWRDHNGGNYVTDIRNQGSCGSCWAFGGVATMESKILIQGNAPGYPLDLSEQYLVSCSAGSCNGWYADATMAYLTSDGSPDETCLPYTASDFTPCSNRCDDWYYRIRQLENWGRCYSVTEMKQALNEGPIVGCFTVYSDFMSYSSGIYQHTWGGEEGGHMICIVGYSEQESYWLCKNSWGGSWGEDGYFRIRMYYNECGIESWAPLWGLAGTADYPNLTVASTDAQETVGDNDGVFNPGETVNLTINLQNAPLCASASGVTAQITCSDPRITILDDQAAYPNLSSSQTAANQDPFALSATANCGLGPVTITMLITANEGAPVPYVVERTISLELSLNQAGFPIAGLQMDASPAVCDLNDDGQMEVISADYAGVVRVVTATGTMLPGFPYQAGGQIKCSPAVGDLDHDGDCEIVFAKWTGQLIVLNANGSVAFTPVELPFYISATPVLGDLDGDDDLEIILGCWDGCLYAYHHDGSPVAGFPFNTGLYQAIQDGALLLDVNQDSVPEILFGSYNHNFYCLDATGTELWHFDLGDIPGASASAAELAFDEPIIVVPTQSGMVWFLTGSGQQSRMINLGAECKSNPAIADVENDGDYEIAINDQAGNIHLLNLHGEDVAGFPVQTGACLMASTSFADLDNDGVLELVVATLSGQLHVLKPDGSYLGGFPLMLSAGSMSTAALVYLDQDQDLEIVVGSLNGLNAIDYKAAGGSNQCWNMYRANLLRTGSIIVNTNLTASIPAEALTLTPQTFTWYPAHPNPCNPATNFSYQLPVASQVKLVIYDLAGRMVAKLIDAQQAEGKHIANWAAVQHGVASGIYFVKFQAEGIDGKSYSAMQKVLLVK